jgi:hypothetical protein
MLVEVHLRPVIAVCLALEGVSEARRIASSQAGCVEVIAGIEQAEQAGQEKRIG